ncbi:Protocadherin-20 [Bienertia sinuspersici]
MRFSWMNHRGIDDRKQPSYLAGVDEFLNVSFNGREDLCQLRCPYLKCNNQLYHDRITIKSHLIAWGIVRDYNPWVYHGESEDQVGGSSSSDGNYYEPSNGEDDPISTENTIHDDLTSLLIDATRTHGKPKRGPTRGLKSRCWREKNPGEKPYAKISYSMRRVVGDKAAQFISECSLWVKEYCPLNSRGWRYRLKEENFVGYTKEQARARRSPGVEQAKWNWLIDDFWSDLKQQEISDKNRRNRMKQTMKHSNGAKSTARILEDLINAPSTQSVTEDGDNNANVDGNANANGDGHTHIQHDEDPI